MAGSRKPGALGRSGEPEDLNDGTMIRAVSPRPGPIASGPSSTGGGQSTASLAPTFCKPARRTKAATSIQVLRQGSRGPEVQKLQRQLNVRLAPSPNLAVDGIFGPLTLQAAQQYQRGVSIAADGVVGKQTWHHLLKGDEATILQPPMTASRPAVALPAATSATAPQPPRATPPPAPPESIWEWPLEKKLLFVLERVPSRLPGRARDEFKSLLQLQNLALSLAVIAGFCLLSGGTALVLGILILGFDVTMSLASALQTAALAATEGELNEAADELAHVVLAVGVGAFIKGVGKIAKGVKGGGKGGAAEAPPTSAPKRAPAQPRPSRQSEQPAGQPPPKATEPKYSSIEIQLDEIYATAPKAKAEVDTLAEWIAHETGGKVAKAPLKGRERALEKAVDDYGGDPSKVKDIARNTIVVEQRQYNKAVALLKKQGAKVKSIESTSDPMGYSGTNAVVKTKAGIPAEIQVNTPEMIFAKEKPEIARAILGEQKYAEISAKSGVPGGRGHQLYEEYRGLASGDPRRDRVAAESRAYYNQVRQAGAQR